MRATTKAGRAVRGPGLEWRDGHALDAERFREPIGEQAGAWVATVRGVEVAVRWYGGHWYVEVGGEAVPYASARELRAASSLVEAAVRACGASGTRTAQGAAFADALRQQLASLGRAEVVAGSVHAALEAVEAVADHDDAPLVSRPERFARALRAVLAEASRRGFAVTAGGEVVETWRAHARGRWVGADEVVEGRATGTAGGGLVRVERGHVLEVYTDATIAEAAADPEGVAWCVRLDGVLAATVEGRRAALDYAVARARGRHGAA